MLHAISWKEYFTLMGLGLGLYYGWMLVRYYQGLKVGARGKADRGRQILPEFGKAVTGMRAAEQVVKVVVAGAGNAGKPGLVAKEGEAGPGVMVAAEEVIGKPDQAIPAQRQGETQETLPMPMPPEIEGGAFLPMLAIELSAELQRLIKKAREEAMVEGELAVAIGQLLSRPPYSRLKGSSFEKKIGEQIARELETYGSIHFDMENVRSWWR
jgi:hypothetical protein